MLLIAVWPLLYLTVWGLRVELGLNGSTLVLLELMTAGLLYVFKDLAVELLLSILYLENL